MKVAVNTITLSLVSNMIFISHAVWTYEFTLGYFSGARVVKSVNLCSYLTTIVYMLSFLFVIVFCPFCLLLYFVLSVCYCILSFLFVIVFCPFCLLLYCLSSSYLFWYLQTCYSTIWITSPFENWTDKKFVHIINPWKLL